MAQQTVLQWDCYDSKNIIAIGDSKHCNYGDGTCSYVSTNIIAIGYSTNCTANLMRLL